jgi:citrate synthase
VEREESYTVTDNRTGESITIPIRDGGIAAAELRKHDPNVFVYDPSYMMTAACKSSITLVDGDKGILR